jgi:hypothetical protein
MSNYASRKKISDRRKQSKRCSMPYAAILLRIVARTEAVVEASLVEGRSEEPKEAGRDRRLGPYLLIIPQKSKLRISTKGTVVDSLAIPS